MPTELRFQNLSRIASSLPVAEIEGVHRDPGDAPLGKPVGKLWPLPVLATVIVSGARLPAAPPSGPRRQVSTLRRRSHASRCCCA